MNSDFFLAQRILRGDEEALRSFYEAHFGRVYHFVLIRVSGDHHQAEEIVQDTFLAGLRAMERFLGESSLYSWLCGIAKHKLIDLRRRELRRTRNEVPFSLLDASGHAALLEVQERAEVQRRRNNGRQELVTEALLALPGHYQSVLTEKYLRRRTTREIALEAGQSPKAIESLLTRARNAFRRNFRLSREREEA